MAALLSYPLPPSLFIQTWDFNMMNFILMRKVYVLARWNSFNFHVMSPRWKCLCCVPHPQIKLLFSVTSSFKFISIFILQNYWKVPTHVLSWWWKLNSKLLNACSLQNFDFQMGLSMWYEEGKIFWWLHLGKIFKWEFFQLYNIKLGNL